MKIFSESLEKKEKDCENSRMFQIHFDSQDVALEGSWLVGCKKVL